MTVPQVSRSEPRPPAVYLWSLWFVWLATLTLLAGHALVVFLGDQWFRPPTDPFVGLPRAPGAVAFRAVIQIFMLWVCVDFTRGRGRWLRPPNWYAGFFLAMVGLGIFMAFLRYGIRMSLYPQERWTGGAVVWLSFLEYMGFMLIHFAYQFFHGGARMTTPRHYSPRLRAIGYFAGGLGGGLCVAVVFWASYITAQYPAPCPC